MRNYHVLNLGDGVQSTTIYLMIAYGELDIKLDATIFSDTKEEPKDVYKHLEWLQSLNGPPITIRTVGRLGDDLINGRLPTWDGSGRSVAHNDHYRHRFASIPAFTAVKEGQPLGIVQRQCTSEYKIEVIERFIRRELLGLKPKQRIPSDVIVHQYMGFSVDEPGRAARTKARFDATRHGRVHFPLFDEVMTRRDCVRWLETHGKVPHEVPRSACVFCPFKSNAEWRRLRDTDPQSWSRACEIDDALRQEGTVANRDLDQKLYVHKHCRPLRTVNLDDDQQSLFDLDCEGGCGL